MENPYQSSLVNPTASPSSYGSQNLEASQTAIYNLAGARGWVRFISVLLFIFFGFCIIGLIGLFTMLGYMGSTGGIVVIVMIIYCVIIFLFALRLGSYASAIGRISVSRNPLDLEEAMVQQMKFWRLSGISTLVMIVLIIVASVLSSL